VSTVHTFAWPRDFHAELIDPSPPSLIAFTKELANAVKSFDTDVLQARLIIHPTTIPVCMASPEAVEAYIDTDFTQAQDGTNLPMINPGMPYGSITAVSKASKRVISLLMHMPNG
jgi:hypothetical protein